MRHHTQRLRVNFVDTDLSGRIHYTAAMRYFETTEHALMRAVFAELDEERPMLPRVHVEADFKAMLSWEDEIDCTARILKVGRSSLTFGYDVVRSDDGLEVITGKIVAVSVDPRGRSAPLSDGLRAALEKDLAAGIP
ncbi:MAG: acyl-CoA thioesterase [Myxococcales bacterium]|nr:acyl-CoA thioesterase [Myxococcales bacterium]